MDRTHEEIPVEERQRFDLLADGELSEAERQALLLSLDQRPNGWRHCALALLEAQCWSREMAAIGTPFVQPVVTGPQVRAADRWASGTRWAILAASLVTAFFLGIAARDAAPPDVAEKGRGSVATAGPSSVGPPTRFAPTDGAAAGGGGPLAVPRTHDASDGQPSTDVDPGAVGPRQVQTSGALADPSNGGAVDPPFEADMVTFLVRGGGGPSARAVQVPLVNAAGLDRDWRPSQALAIPGPVLQRLRQAGHQITWQRRYAPLPLDDGRQIVFPVDDVEITPVVSRTY